jgi:putative colanic acid biosysnthesis UDP-glucose lipid carrier transferase
MIDRSNLRVGVPMLTAPPPRAKLNMLAACADAFWICVALALVCNAWSMAWDSRHSVMAAAAVVLFYLVGQVHGIYRTSGAEPILREFTRTLMCWALVIPMLSMLAFITKSEDEFSRSLIGTWWCLAPTLIASWRALMRATLQGIRARGYNTRPVAIFGASTLGEQVANSIKRSPVSGLRVVGFYDDRQSSRMPTRDAQTPAQAPASTRPFELRGDLERLVAAAEASQVEVIYIALPVRAEARINDIIGRLQHTNASVSLAYDFGGFDVLHAQWGQVGDVPVMSVVENPFRGIEGFTKRAEDLVLGSLIMLLIALPMLLIALAIKLTSRGPVFFRQRRYGLNGEEIRVLKFRSMSVMEDGAEVKQAVKNDTRVTKVGAFLRRSSLDELPQFLQVLTGEMSIVGPRPHAVVHNEQYRALIQGYMLRHKVKPGITGWAQVNGWRGETDTLEKMTKRVEYDLTYIRDWELWLDVKIILMTIFSSLRNENAY